MGLYTKTRGRALATVAVMSLLVSLSSCGSSPKPQPTASSSPTTTPISVVASTNQWGSLARQIGGKDVNVTSVIPSGSSDGRDFEPKASDIAALRKASVLVSNGAGYDAWAVKELPKGAQNISAAETVGAMDGDNPYLWFSEDARKAMASELADVFSKERPAKKKTFATRLKQWNAEETKLDKTVKDFRTHRRSITYAATETVAYYLMADMGLKDLTPRGYEQSLTSSEASTPTDLKDFQHLLEQHKVDLLITSDHPVGDDPTATLVTSAKQGKVPTLNISEQMPQGTSDLTSWILGIVHQLSTTIPEDEDTTNPSDTGTPSSPSTNSANTHPSDPTAKTETSKR